MQNYSGVAIRSNRNNLKGMKKTVVAILFHYNEMNNESNRHRFCQQTKDT